MARLPFVFLDRSLGRIQVPHLLRAAGVELITLAEHYGIPADENVEDTIWIRDSAERGWISFMKDFAIKRRPAETDAIRDSRARCFCLANANMKAAAMAERYITNLDRIARAAEHAGPLLYTVQDQRLEPVQLND
jgi:hypothetical protein